MATKTPATAPASTAASTPATESPAGGAAPAQQACPLAAIFGDQHADRGGSFIFDPATGKRTPAAEKEA
ncbi:hypothetical protein [uncultured Azohydromonas sp.]|jgi:hypothetical protein|uniref:hypothetical protein n=1 Tax=uncultured Azohydromonas sp. TaxID=487342 RepID=UPI002608A8D7|nr:hypothetical protein [uncultured Azohydromonas sp.]